MNKNILLLILLSISIIACKKDVEEKPLNVKEPVTTKRLVSDFTCNGKTYVFQVPSYEGDDEVQKRLNKDIINLITQDFIDVTHNKEASLNELWETFIDHREQNICKGNNSGIENITIEHTTQTDGVLSYEISYLRNNKLQRILKTFKKPELTELTIIDLAKPAKSEDVRQIYDINLQQSVANLGLEIKPEDQPKFLDFIDQKVYNYSQEEFKAAALGVRQAGVDSVYLQVLKRVDIPSSLPYLNHDVKVEILASEMGYYLDLAPLKM